MPADNLIVPVDSLESGIPTMPTDPTNQPISEQNITSSQTVRRKSGIKFFRVKKIFRVMTRVTEFFTVEKF